MLFQPSFPPPTAPTTFHVTYPQRFYPANAYFQREDRDEDPKMWARAQEIIDEGLPGFTWSGWSQTHRWPWQHIHSPGEDERHSGIVIFSGPFEDNPAIREASIRLFWALKEAGLFVVGSSSYEDFPAEIINPGDSRHVKEDMLPILAHTDAWLHPFRDPVAHKVSEWRQRGLRPFVV